MNTSITSHLRNNWFKILIVGLVIYIFFQKDLSFQVNLQSPYRTQQPEPVPETEPEVSGSTERMTDASQASISNPSLFDRLDIFSFGATDNHVSLKASLDQISSEEQLAYLKRFAHVAISERSKFGVPSSILLSSALLHSAAGTLPLAQEANNHFMLSADNGWTNEEYTFGGKSYRSYENAWSSFRDHSIFLSNLDFGRRGKPGSTDYQAWAKWLSDNHYSPEPNLERVLLELIDTYQLNDLDLK